MGSTGALWLALAILAVPLAAEGQRAQKIHRVGYLTAAPQSPAPGPQLTDMLREVGYIEGQNLVLEWRGGEGKPERLAEQAAELVRLKVDVIVAWTNDEIIAAKRVTTSIPIVMFAAFEPVDAGFVASLARPGGNVTGMVWSTPENAGKGLQILREAAPKIKRVAFIRDPTYRGFEDFAKLAEVPARRLGITAQLIDFRQPGDLDQSLARIRQGGADALSVWVSGPIAVRRPQIVDFAIRHQLPSLWSSPLSVRAGGLMSYTTNRTNQLRRTAGYVDKILKDAKPAELPVEEPTHYELVINLKTAKTIGLTIPPALLGRADQVIE